MGRPVEQRYNGQGGPFDVYGRPRQRLRCVMPDPNQQIGLADGKILRQYPLVAIKDGLCSETEGLVTERGINLPVDSELCELQRDAGVCPRGLRLEGF